MNQNTQPRRVKAAFIWPFAIVLTFILASFVATAYSLEVRVRDPCTGLQWQRSA